MALLNPLPEGFLLLPTWAGGPVAGGLEPDEYFLPAGSDLGWEPVGGVLPPDEYFLPPLCAAGSDFGGVLPPDEYFLPPLCAVDWVGYVVAGFVANDEPLPDDPPDEYDDPAGLLDDEPDEYDLLPDEDELEEYDLPDEDEPDDPVLPAYASGDMHNTKTANTASIFFMLNPFVAADGQLYPVSALL